MWLGASSANARSMSPTLPARQSTGDALSSAVPVPADSFEAGMAQLGGHGAFIEHYHPNFAWRYREEIGQIYGRYFDGIAIRHCDWKLGNPYLNEVARNNACLSEHAVRYLSSLPMPC